jgi:hypothetical protein
MQRIIAVLLAGTVLAGCDIREDYSPVRVPGHIPGVGKADAAAPAFSFITHPFFPPRRRNGGYTPP